MKTLALAGVKGNDINLFDFKRTNRTLNDFHMKQTTQNLNNLRKNDDSKLKLYFCILSFDELILNQCTYIKYWKREIYQTKGFEGKKDMQILRWGRIGSSFYYPRAFQRKSRNIVIPQSFCNVTPFKLRSQKFHRQQPYAIWIRIGGTHSKFWCNSWGQGQGGWPQRVQNPFYTNIVMLHIKSKVMKSRIQWCKKSLPWGHVWGSSEVKK